MNDSPLERLTGTVLKTDEYLKKVFSIDRESGTIVTHYLAYPTVDVYICADFNLSNLILASSNQIKWDTVD
ncbi:hypothetical protein [Chamaesiphon sp.]|uniref:hypothetical protein n=1 Tax=Chamaesiphon sp. TaxID=2814140 RepID=UPI003593FE3D